MFKKFFGLDFVCIIRQTKVIQSPFIIYFLPIDSLKLALPKMRDNASFDIENMTHTEILQFLILCENYTVKKLHNGIASLEI